MDNKDDGEDTKQNNNKKPYPAWHNFVAGGVAGAGSRVATAPLDLIRIRRQLTPASLYPSESLWQSWTKIVQTEGGVTALFRGNTAALQLWIGYSAVQFSLYNHVRDYLTVEWQCSASLASFGAGATAGTCATLATYPFDVCRTTFAARGIVAEKQEGKRQISAAVVVEASRRPLPFSSLVEPQYHHQRQHHQHLPPQKQNAPTTKPPRNAPPKTLTEFAVQLYQQKGFPGFYAGAGPAVLQIVPYMGLNFMIYDSLVAGDRRVKNSGYAGAISGATSKILVYPIDTVKRRLQAQAFYNAPTNGGSLAVGTQYKGMVDCVTRIAREEGFASFYRGVVPSVLKTTIASSLSFALFRFSKNTVEWAHDLAYETKTNG